MAPVTDNVRRWPLTVYAGGSESDQRFSLANERTSTETPDPIYAAPLVPVSEPLSVV